MKPTLEQLDSAANLLMTVADGDQKGACAIAPGEAKRLLMALHPILDEKRNAFIATLTQRSSGKPVANPGWDETCAKDCHCGLYSSILEGIGDSRMHPSDRAALARLESKAQKVTHEDLLACAKASSWFCGSPLLRKLRKDARNYPKP